MAIQTSLRRCKCGGKSRPPESQNCVTLPPDTPIKKPDLAIYSQIEELSLGNIPTWDSPDIVTNEWRPFRLLTEALVTIRNLSVEAPAINTLVHYSISPFGIGMREELKLSKRVNVAVGSEVQLKFPLDQQTVDGDPRVGAHIRIEHPHDPVRINNAGSQVHDGGFTSESGRNFTVQIPVLNNSNFTREIQLGLMPTDGIVASIDPVAQTFAPFQETIATLSIQVSGALSGTPGNSISRAVTVVGQLSTGELIGGVTRLLRIDD